MSPAPSPFGKKHRLPIHMVRTRQDGRECYFFLMCSHQKLRALQHQLAQGAQDTVDLTSYGTVIASGFGAEVSANVRDMLREKYGYDVKG